MLAKKPVACGSALTGTDVAYLGDGSPRDLPSRERNGDTVSSGHFQGRKICFSSFTLLPEHRLLLDDERPLPLGSRAFDLLMALVERPGELVSKEALMARAWPNTFVDPANLTVNISALRRALRDGQGGNRFFINIPGRGYRFVTPTKVSGDSETPPQFVHNLPTRVSKLFGRDEVIRGLADTLNHHRMLSIVGAAGVGKTSVAQAVAEQLLPLHDDGVWLIDLSTTTDPGRLLGVLAGALKIGIDGDELLAKTIAVLKNRRSLLILDTCEHVINGTAELAAAILKHTHHAKIIATSREPLRVEGERVYWLPPLQCVPAEARGDAKAALDFPAVQLFVDRAGAATGDFSLTDEDAPVVADICAKLDGLPLAIELAASQVGCFGVRNLASRLAEPGNVLTGGARTAPARQCSMEAAFDWSYGTLSKQEQEILRGLSIFPGVFSVQAARHVLADRSGQIMDSLMSLIAKSLLVAEKTAIEPRLSLLNTTRIYALAKVTETGELEALSKRYSIYSRGSSAGRSRVVDRKQIARRAARPRSRSVSVPLSQTA